MDQAEKVAASPVWRPADLNDLDAIMAIQDQVHSMLPEGREAFANKLELFGEGCRVLARGGHVLGYGIAYPWRLGDVPPLDTGFAAWPDGADCLFVHDVALMPAARGSGAGRAYIDHAVNLARREGLPRLALVSVYDSRPIWAACGFAAVGPDPSLTRELAKYGPTACYMTADA